MFSVCWFWRLRWIMWLTLLTLSYLWFPCLINSERAAGVFSAGVWALLSTEVHLKTIKRLNFGGGENNKQTNKNSRPQVDVTLTCAAALLLVMKLNWIRFTAEEFICCSSVTGRIRVSLIFKAKVSSMQFDFICFATPPEQTASRIPNTDKCCHLVDIKHFLSLNDYVFIKSLYIYCL